MKSERDLIFDLDALNAVDAGPFPYEGCRRLKSLSHIQHEGLIPDLDMYLSELAGYRSWGTKILRWPDEKIELVYARVNDSFFERYPAYQDLQPLLKELVAPDVSRALEIADRTRATLKELLSQIRRKRRETNN